jgi:hypothetical protein
LHSYARTVASIISSVVDLQHISLAVTIAACATTAAVGCVVFWTLANRIPPWPIRLGLVAAIVVMPVGSIETNGTLANAHWYLMIALFSVLLSRQATLAGKVVAALIVLVAVTSDPLGIIFVPLVVARLSDSGRVARWIVPGAFLLGAIMQLITVSQTHIQQASETPDLFEVARTLGFRAYLEALVGQSGAEASFGLLGLKALVLATVCVVLMALLASRSGASGLVIVPIVAGSAFLIVSVVVRWYPGQDPIMRQLAGGSRYDVVPVALISIAICGAITSIPRLTDQSSRVLSWLAVAAVAIALVTSVIVSWGVSSRTSPYNWNIEVAAVAQRCSTEHGAHREIVAATPEGFPFILTCGQIMREIESR